MLYRWCMEHRNGTLVENKHMKKQKPSPKRVNPPPDSEAAAEDELAKAKKRIKDMEKQLNARQEELELLKRHAGYSRKTVTDFCVYRVEPGSVQYQAPLPVFRCVSQRLLCLAHSPCQPSSTAG